MTETADTVQDLTPEWFTAALREGGTLGSDAAVAPATSELAGTGQFGLVVRADLEYDTATNAPASVIVKLPSRDAGSRQLGASSLFPFLLTIAVWMTLEQTERGDPMWARMLSGTVDLIEATGASDVLD